MSLAQSHFEKLLAGVLPKSLSLIISVLLLSTLWASAADPLGATPHSDGSTTFRVWAPFVDAVAVKANGGTAVPLASEDGHPDPADTTWVGTVPGVKAVEVLPITQNPLFSDHPPADHDWGYDPVQLYAVKSKYGTPQEFKEFVKQCHQRQIAVIVDVVYNHLVENNLLKEFGGFTRPEIPGGIYLYAGDRAHTGLRPPPDSCPPPAPQHLIE